MPLPALAIAGIAAAANAGMGLMSNRMQYNQQEKLQDLQLQGNKEMLRLQQEKEYEMWKKTGYVGQMEQMKKAGINPALLYGMSGGGGQTTGSSAPTVTGGQAHSMDIGSMVRPAMEIALMKAQKENIEADTENKRTDTVAVKPATASKLYADADKLTQETKIITGTLEEQIQKIKGESESAWTKGKVDTSTINEQIQQKVDEAIQVSLRNANISQDTANKIAEIAQKWKGLDLEERKTAVLELTGGEQKDQDQIINVINTIVGIISRFIPGGRYINKKH